MLLLGAGGAARAIGNILAEEKAHLTILNRQQRIILGRGPCPPSSPFLWDRCEGRGINPRKSEKGNGWSADILVNATSLGMSPDNDETPVPADLLYANLTVFDVVYNPLQTRLLREAKAAGARTISGLEMLVWQGAIAFEKWTGIKAPVDVMRQSALSLLQKNEK